MRAKGESKELIWAYVPKRLAQKLDLILMDLARGRVAYGAKTALFTELLSRWLEEIQKKGDEDDNQQPGGPHAPQEPGD